MRGTYSKLVMPLESQPSKITYYLRYFSPPFSIALLTLVIYAVYTNQPYFWEATLRTERAVKNGCASVNGSEILPFPAGIPSDAKVILFWNKFFGAENPFLPDKLEACKSKKCFLTEDRRYLSQSTAVIFHIRDLQLSDLPTCRDAWQLYVFFLLESPHHTGIDLTQSPWPGFFNLTWTYRRDSDVFCTLYLDKFHPTIWSDRNATRQLLTSKRNRALIFSSNCHTAVGREDYIRELQRHFPVDIIGKCGRDACPTTNAMKDCAFRPELYKFYLSFENSYCMDYITEKAIRPFNQDTVPIVMGGGNYTEMFPTGSFINTADFRSPKDLADYLRTLVENVDLYARFYDWKFDVLKAQLPAFTSPGAVSICKLCDILHNDAFTVQQYSDIHDWWVTKANCTKSWTG